MVNLQPLEGRVLVELMNIYSNISVSEKKYDSKTSGVVLKVADDDKDHAFLVGKKIYWRQYNEGETLYEKYAFVKLEDIDGYE